MSDTTAVPTVGSRLADIALTGPDGTATSLDRVRDGRRAVAYFLRASSCVICLGHARALGAMAAAGELGDTAVILVTPGDAAQAAQAMARLEGTGAAVWASGEAHAEVGLGSFLAIQHSGSFLIDADGTLRYTRASTLPMGSFSRTELLDALSE